MARAAARRAVGSLVSPRAVLRPGGLDTGPVPALSGPAAADRAEFLLQSVQAMQAAGSTRALEAEFLAFAAAIGLPHVVGSTVRPGGASGADACCEIWLDSRPPAWGAALAKSGGDCDPTVRAALASRAPVVWSDLLGRAALSRHERGLLRLAARFRASDGVTVPVLGPTAGPGVVATVVSLSGPMVPVRPHLTTHLAIAAQSLCNRRAALLAPAAGGQARLTAREVEVLGWIAAGKYDWQIGRIIGISAKTVNYHVENAKRKLDVATRIQAVVEALRSGLMPLPAEGERGAAA